MLTALGVPDIPPNHQRINRNFYAVQDFPNQEFMVNAILSEYYKHITTYENYFSEWDAIYNQLYLKYIKR